MLILKNAGADMRHYRDRNFHSSSHSDDANLWVLIQRVCRREDEKDRRLQAASQLQEFVIKPDNKQVLSRCLEQVLNSLIDVFFERSGVTLQKDVANVIGLIGHHMAQDAYAFFQWMLRQFQNIANDNVRNYLLESLHKLLQLDLEERKFANVIMMLMDELQAALGNIDSPDQLHICINPLVLIAQNYPAAFSRHFRDTVDILVGWHIDHTQKIDLTLFVSKSLVNLHAHWLTDLQFSLTLLSQFLEDMEAYAEDFHKLQNGDLSDDGKSSIDSCLPKMAALMRAFSTVVRSIGPVFHANNGPPITESFILETLQRIIICAQLAGDGSIAVTCAADECARLLLGAVQWRKEEMLSESLLTYAVHAVEKSRSEPRLLLVLDFITVMVQEVGSALPPWFIQGLLGPSCRLLSLKHARNPKLCSELLALYQACLVVKSVPLLQTAYRHVAGELQHAINKLLAVHARQSSDDENLKLNFIPDNPFESDSQSPDADQDKPADNLFDVDLIDGSNDEKLLKTAIFDVVALHEIADAKNSLIGMYALSPSIFNLLHSGLQAVHTHLSALFPELQYSILHTLYSHCQRHKNFLSSFLGGPPVPPVDPGGGGGGGFMDNVTTATHHHYPSILELLSKLLIQKTTSSDARTLLMHWTKEIMERLKTSKDVSLLTVPSFAPLMHSLTTVCVNTNPKDCILAASCLQLALTVTSTPAASVLPVTATLHDLVTQTCLVQVWNMDYNVRKAFAELLSFVPVDKVLSYGGNKHDTNRLFKTTKPSKHIMHKTLSVYGHRECWSAKRVVMSKLGESNFHAHHFKDLMSRLLKMTSLGNVLDSNLLEKLYWSCQRQDYRQILTASKLPEPLLPPLAVHDQSFVLWWALWRSADYTVANKLRTPLGRPQDTFTKIEGAVREYEQKLASGSVPTVLSKSGKGKELSPRSSNLEASFASLQRPHLIMQFLDNLGKVLYNAYEGCAVAIPPPNKAVRTFFSTNRQTCEQWLNRLHLAIMKISLTCRLPTLAVHHGQTVLHDMRQKKNTSGIEFESAIVMTVEALIEIGSVHSIEGLYRWCREVGGTKQQWAWMKAAKLNASRNYEDAAKEYKQILTYKKPVDNSNGDNSQTENPSKKSFNPAKTLISKQLIKCYTELSDVDELEKWLKNSTSDDPSNSYVNLDYVKALGKFDDLDIDPATESCQAYLRTAGKSPGSPRNGVVTAPLFWDWSDLYRVYEIQSINERRNLVTSESPVKSSLQSMSKSSLDCVKLSSSYWPPKVDEHFFSMYAVGCAIKKATDKKQDFLQFPFSGKLLCSDWMAGSCGSRLLSHMQLNSEQTDTKRLKLVSALRVNIAKSHRKHNNVKAAQRLLMKEITSLTVQEDTSSKDMKDLLTCCRNLPENAESLSSVMNVKYESAKLLHSTNRATDSMTLLAETASNYLESGAKTCGLQCSRSLLTLTKYLQADWKNTGPLLMEITNLNGSSSSPEEKLVKQLKFLVNLERHGSLSFAANPQLVAQVNQEIVLGSLLNLSTLQAPDLAKSWFALAGWCYKWGRKIIDGASTAGSVELTEDEKNQVKSILLPLGVGEEQLEEVYGVLRKAHCSTASMQIEGDTLDDISMNQSDQQNYLVISEAVLEQLNSRCGSWLSCAPPQISHSLLAVWQHVCMRLFAQYRLAAHAYFKFLSLNSGDQASQKYDDGNVTATLRLLRLLVKHALELQSTLKNGIATAPTSPWRGIIPQLFSRLNHPEPYVQLSIAELLCRVAVQSPHLIIYPVVVATTRSDPRAHNILRTALDEQDTEEDEDGSAELEKMRIQEEEAAGEETGMNCCYKRVLQALSQQNEATVRDVQLLVVELRRITLLWDELWLGTLNQHQHDILRRLHQLQDEAKRVNSNTTLTKSEKQMILREQQQAIMRPVVYAMRRVQCITSAKPETAHEKWFAENVQPMIEQSLERLQNPPNPHNPQSCWAGFKQVHTLLQNRASKRSSHILNLGEISPNLMTLRSTSMPIPGVTDSSHPITIEGCSSAVTILPTKTKPKKLQFIGSDGRRYTYLFKGLEDLHLDERIMQFLSIANCLLRRQHEQRHYVARHYSVTPLGARSGLIQWVSGATPLFLLYKRWQQRQAVAAASKQTNTSVPPNIQIMRPSDLYYSKLNPAMKKAGVDMDRTSRKDWPIDVLRSVLNELLTETPDDLLQKELWCSATGPAEYWDMQQKYTQSTAVMSMIGYVIGLGDRHLDNVLVDLETGEVVHIDYNVCFEKGMQLRVPERVPFRLTQNLLRALGLPGVEGVFRNSCEQVLSTLRKGRETLLTLLEAFVYDPLVDWTGAVEGGYAGAVYGGGGGQQSAARIGDEEEKLSKKDMEREITRSLFSSRIAEMKQGWFNNRDEMLKALPMLVEKLNEYKTHFKNNVEMNESIQNLLEVKSQVKTALNDSRHPYNNLPYRWQQHRQQQMKKETTLNHVQDKITSCEENLKRCGLLLSVLQSPELAALLAEATTALDIGPCAFEHASKFLHSAGQASMVSQAQMTEKELMTISNERRHAMRSCLDILSQYAAIAAQFPPQGVLRSHREAIWSRRLEKMVDGLLRVDCSTARSEIEKSRSKETLLTQTRASSAKDSTLQREVATLNTELMKLIERRNREPVTAGKMGEAERLVAKQQDIIINFVKESGRDGLGPSTAVLTILLCALDQGAVAMETAASGAGHRLVDMTSQEGDWFLEELCGLFANVVQLLRVGDVLMNGLVPNSDVKSSSIVKGSSRCVICADNVFRALLELFNNFRNIIAPEAVKHLQCEEPSVIELVSAISTIVQGVRLDDLTKQLMSFLRNQGMQNGTTSSYEDALSEAQRLQRQYNQLLQDSRQKRSDEQRLTAGQMLLQAFDGLFCSVQKEFLSLLFERSRLHVPHEWSFVDVLTEPLQLQKLKNLPGPEDALQAIMFIKQIQSMHDFFVLCQSNCRAFLVDRMPSSGKNTMTGHHYMGSKSLYSEDRLAKPIKHFISHFVQELLIGIPSEVLGYATCSYIELHNIELASFVRPNQPPLIAKTICDAAVEAKYTQNFLAKPTMLIYQFHRAWKDFDRAQRLDANIAATRSSLQRAQLQVTRFQWLHEDLLEAGANTSFVLPRRRDVINDLNKRMSTLRHLEAMFQQVKEKAMTQNTSIQQRLKWAAGANPSLQTVLSSVEADVQTRSRLLDKEASLSEKIMDVCEKAISFEQSRLAIGGNTSEVDGAFVRLLDSCESVCRVISTTPIQIDPQEQLAVEILPPKPGLNTEEWLQKVSEKLHQNVAMNRQQRQQEEQKMGIVKSKLRDLVTSVKQLLSGHSRLLSDVKALLKTMAKEEDSVDEDADASSGVGSVRKYMERYKELTSMLNDTLMDVLQGCEASTMLDPDPLIERLTNIAGMVVGVYEDLVAFANPYLENSSERNQPTFATALRVGTGLPNPRGSPGPRKPTVLTLGGVNASPSAGTPNTPPMGLEAGAGSTTVAPETGGSAPSKTGASSGVATSPKKKVRDPKTGKAIQERNYFAVSVWRKVKTKLDGRDAETGKRLQAAEQVDHVISEATSLDNLSMLYEGWTAWV
uniref:non-specific serine/threonine protein kinase n=1 Tax=Phallusia mammillata TaxID=59560 RepID=A0A6F9DTQ5_9ASCI|nr:serine/threonine-protein kinase SMG1 [Phallusia mammillata]